MKFRVYLRTSGHAFMQEIAALLQSSLTELGCEAELIFNGRPKPVNGIVDILINPFHQFRSDGPNKIDPEFLTIARNSILVTVEQPGSSWFEWSLRYARQAPLVLDINYSSTQALISRGVNAFHLPLGYHSSWDAWGRDTAARRSVDVLFMGALTERRMDILAQAARTLAPLQCKFLLVDPDETQREEGPNFVVGAEKFRLLADSKILLNIHRDTVPYFEWHGTMGALANGCLVISEPSSAYAPLRAMEHFVEAPAELLADYALSLTLDDNLRSRITKQAYDFVKQELSMASLLKPFFPYFEEQAQRSKPRRPRRVKASSPANAATSAFPFLPQARRLARRARDRFLSPVKPLQSEINVLRRSIKPIIVSQTALRRRLESFQSQLAFGDPAHVEIEKTPSFDLITPDVSVVVPLYNYEEYIEECLESVLASTQVLPEILVIDDNSQDRSRDTVRRFMAANDEFPIALVCKKANRGLSAARNTGCEMARTDYLLLLDADNTLYPDALHKLADALAASGSQMAYCILERFGEGSPWSEPLANAFPWERFRFVYGNYIDALSMIKKPAWRAVGGFDFKMDDSFGGWEDYALWLAFAERSFQGVLVPEMLARYRCHHESMSSTASIETDSIFDYLRAKYSRLPWPEPVD